MISLFRKRTQTSIVLELKKNYIIDSIVDNFKNELLFPGNISVTITGLEEGIDGVWTLKNVNTKQEIGSFTGSQTIERLDVGEYEIIFNSIDKYLTPESQRKLLAERQTITILGNYVRNLGDFNIVIDSNLKNFNTELANWSITGLSNGYFKQGTGLSLITNLSVGNYNIIFDPIAGFTTPDVITSSIEPNKTKDVLGLYVMECSGTTGNVTGTTGADIVITTPYTLPTAFVGVFYELLFNATGGTPPYRWYLNQNSVPLPLGLNLELNGLLSGIPTQNTGIDYKLFIIDVHDAYENIKSKTFRMKIAFEP